MEKNSPDGGFLQSENWRLFQEQAGRKTYSIEKEDFVASIIEHSLPLLGKYFYVPRGPIFEVESEKLKVKSFLGELVDLARKENAGWIRIEPANEEILEKIKGSIKEKISKAPHDVQPKEVFILDIAKPEEQLLSEMKSKTRYNLNLARKKGVRILSGKQYTEDFLRLTKEMATRQSIGTHPENYYRRMIESFPEDMLSVYAAEFGGKIIAANLVLFFGKFATYLHGASGNENRNVMAPFLLQWQAISDAKKRGCEKYDFGGVQTAGVRHVAHSDLTGVTNFKLGFSPETKTVVFPGSYDIVINPRAYALYRGLQKAKAFAKRFKK
ncbi:MAG TPA: peptidoglycan bridge formation glycyltransferase FemA/FemB family protein [Patescibacteria group bacterium]